MREILFKAIRTDNGEWAEGYIIRDCVVNTHEMYIGYLCGGGGMRTKVVEIDPATLCQFTGLIDKNGQEIWENDIVRIDDDWIGRVIWKNEDTAFAVFPNNDIEHETYCVGYYANECEIEVIRNIFDNPELSEGGAE